MWRELEEEIYMQQTEEFQEKGKEDYVCMLKKSLYGKAGSTTVVQMIWHLHVEGGLHQE